jgi:hypothetical protein
MAELYQKHPDKFNEEARRWTQQFASMFWSSNYMNK